MYNIEPSLIDNSFEDKMQSKIDAEKLLRKVKSFYNIRKKHTNCDLFQRDFYIFNEKIANNRKFTDIAKDLKISYQQVQHRFQIISYYIERVRNNIK